jgi:hypothetical protein
VKPAKLRRAEVDDAKAIKARSSYLEMFASVEDALAWQKSALQTRTEFLPPCARTVRDGGAPTAIYWRWLAAQAEAWS